MNTVNLLDRNCPVIDLGAEAGNDMVTVLDQDLGVDIEDLGVKVEDQEVEEGDQEVKIGREEDIVEGLDLDPDQLEDLPDPGLEKERE